MHTNNNNRITNGFVCTFVVLETTKELTSNVTKKIFTGDKKRDVTALQQQLFLDSITLYRSVETKDYRYMFKHSAYRNEIQFQKMAAPMTTFVWCVAHSSDRK
jgi:hypothetical protein